ncbi:hypothetical protein [Streptomyces sp. NPDC020965]|uniref:hypothetical protein n=1 Tax=Streptomyces sp. NPDC020965 TaxID=3365105 RepID=UPI003790D48D
MSTTRHLINRQRRLASAAKAALTDQPPGAAPTDRPAGGDGTTGAPSAPESGSPVAASQPRSGSAPARFAGATATGSTDTDPAAAPPRRWWRRTGAGEETARPDRPVPGAANPEAPGTDETDRTPEALETSGAQDAPRAPSPRNRTRLVAVLGVLTVLLGGFAAFAGGQAAGLRDDPAVRNSALTDLARTSELKGQITRAVEAVFSYDFAQPAALDRAVRDHLTGAAVRQHGTLLASVRAAGPRQKLVLTTTVTRSGVELIEGDRARVLVYADQSNTRTATKGETTYAAAMVAVDAVRVGDTWRIAAIDTFGAAS